MSERVEAGAAAARKPAAISPEEMLKQAVTGATKANEASSADAVWKPSLKLPRFGANARLAAASLTALACGLAIGVLAAPGQGSGDVLAQVQAELATGRAETARLSQEFDRLTRTATAARETSEAARGEAKALGASLADRIGRSEQNLERRLASLSETLTRSDREQGERIAGLIAQLDKKAQPVTAAAPPKPEPKAEARIAEPTQTGSLPDKAKTETVENWALRDVYDGVAVLEDRRRRLVEVARGDAVPGVGRVEAIERRGRQWVVVTRQGVITPQTW
ncbi:hypothetical protein [Methylorubrum zatmanii]|uniref:Uncharacterized protein n=1 Tax=Methylorubrum zatmanii TaxID=29429 RepID=A0ABW1WTH4_9HYPH|nr:hypothetical protein [Methylorubrum zatmanii]MBD8906785.1 hypothetical protein [Methylorubrum zatmanii]